MQDPASVTYLLPAGFGVDRTDPAITITGYYLSLYRRVQIPISPFVGPAACTLLPLC